MESLLLTFVNAEIDPDVDFDSRRAVYFRQMRYGLFVSAIHMVAVCSYAYPYGSDPYGPLGKRNGLKVGLLDS